MLKYLLILLLLVTATSVTFSQTTEATSVQATTNTGNAEIEMADILRRDGKIYVVVAVLVTVLAGLIFYLIRLDRKVSKLEQQFKS